MSKELQEKVSEMSRELFNFPLDENDNESIECFNNWKHQIAMASRWIRNVCDSPEDMSEKDRKQVVKNCEMIVAEWNQAKSVGFRKPDNGPSR